MIVLNLKSSFSSEGFCSVCSKYISVRGIYTSRYFIFSGPDRISRFVSPSAGHSQEIQYLLSKSLGKVPPVCFSLFVNIQCCDSDIHI